MLTFFYRVEAAAMTIELSPRFDTKCFVKDVAFDLSRPRQGDSTASDLAFDRSPDKRFIGNHSASNLTGFTDAEFVAPDIAVNSAVNLNLAFAV